MTAHPRPSSPQQVGQPAPSLPDDPSPKTALSCRVLCQVAAGMVILSGEPCFEQLKSNSGPREKTDSLTSISTTEITLPRTVLTTGSGCAKQILGIMYAMRATAPEAKARLHGVAKKMCCSPCCWKCFTSVSKSSFRDAASGASHSGRCSA